MSKPYEQRIGELDRQIAQIQARRRDVAARHSAVERKAASRAQFQAGALVMECFDGGWKTIEWEKLAELLERNGAAIGRCIVPDGETSDEASKRLRDFQREQRGGHHEHA